MHRTSECIHLLPQRAANLHTTLEHISSWSHSFQGISYCGTTRNRSSISKFWTLYVTPVWCWVHLHTSIRHLQPNIAPPNRVTRVNEKNKNWTCRMYIRHSNSLFGNYANSDRDRVSDSLCTYIRQHTNTHTSTRKTKWQNEELPDVFVGHCILGYIDESQALNSEPHRDSFRCKVLAKHVVYVCVCVWSFWHASN